MASFLLYALVFCFFGRPCYTEQLVGTAADALSLYFGEKDFIPPLVNSTYGGETEIIVLEGENVSLICSASYRVLWIVPSTVSAILFVLTFIHNTFQK